MISNMFQFFDLDVWIFRSSYFPWGCKTHLEWSDGLYSVANNLKIWAENCSEEGFDWRIEDGKVLTFCWVKTAAWKVSIIGSKKLQTLQVREPKDRLLERSLKKKKKKRFSLSHKFCLQTIIPVHCDHNNHFFFLSSVAKITLVWRTAGSCKGK